MATAKEIQDAANKQVAMTAKNGDMPGWDGTGIDPDKPNKPVKPGGGDGGGFPDGYDPDKPNKPNKPTGPDSHGPDYPDSDGDGKPDETPGPDKPNKPNKPDKPVGKPDLSITPGVPDKNDPGAMNVVDYGSQIATDPSLGFTHDNPDTKGTNESMLMEDHLQGMDVSKGLIDGNANNLQMKTDKLDVDATGVPRINQEKDKNVSDVDPTKVNGYDVATTQDKVVNGEMTGAHGTLSDGSVINPNEVPQIDVNGIATGTNADGSVNQLGKALQKYAAQDMSNIIDTSTLAGKQLAATLGEGNYTDSKATLKGQLEILQSEFVNPVTGEPKIPSWAAATARNVGKIAAFKGMSGTAATAAMSQALLEASIPIAQADSQFFQTLTLQNLDNRQQSVINAANTLAKFEQTNVDNRMAAAIQNSKAFLEMDMANLDNEQQAKVINTQARVQSILEDAKAKNAERLFVSNANNENNKFYDEMNVNTQTKNADRALESDKFYDELNTQIRQYNSAQNLDAQKFNSTLEDSREKFYKEMQYNIDVSNAKWRQEVQLTEDQQQFEAATTDVKNMVDLSVNQLNQIWDRSDALLDYAFKATENEADRKAKLAEVALAGDNAMDAQFMESLGTLAGTFVGSNLGQSMLGKLFGF